MTRSEWRRHAEIREATTDLLIIRQKDNDGLGDLRKPQVTKAVESLTASKGGQAGPPRNLGTAKRKRLQATRERPHPHVLLAPTRLPTPSTPWLL